MDFNSGGKFQHIISIMLIDFYPSLSIFLVFHSFNCSFAFYNQAAMYRSLAPHPLFKATTG